MTQSKRIAVTGGIGSGKSTFCNLLLERGYPVYSCDKIQCGLLQTSSYLKELQKLFPNCFVNGKLEKALLSELVFSCAEERKRLEEFSHPRIMRLLLQKMRGHSVSFAEVPLLFEGGFEKLFDGVIALVCKDENRIANVVRRDGLTEQEVLRRIRSQIPPSTLAKKNCIIIENDGSLQELNEKVSEVLKQLGMS